MKTRKPIPDTHFFIDFPLDGKPPLLGPDLTDKEMFAVGYVTCQWAFLEHAIFADTVLRARRAKVAVPSDAISNSFSRRLRAWRVVALRPSTRSAEKDRLSRLYSTIANLESKRHQVTHGLWSWDVKAPHKLTAYSFRPKVAFLEPFDSDKIWELGDRIGQVSFQFIYPGGKDHAYREWAKAASQAPSVSRSWLLSLRGKDPDSPDHSPGRPC